MVRCRRSSSNGQQAVSVVSGDLSELASVRRAAAEIVALHLPIAGLLNNAGIMGMRPTRNSQGGDMTFATNHLGPFALTEALVPHLPDGANIVFVVSGVEDPERPPVKAMGMRGGRYIRRKLVRAVNGSRPDPGSRAWTPTRRPSNATLLPSWLCPENCRGCASTPLSRASIRRPVWAAQTVSCVSCLVKSSHGCGLSADTEVRPTAQRES